MCQAAELDSDISRTRTAGEIFGVNFAPCCNKSGKPRIARLQIGRKLLLGGSFCLCGRLSEKQLSDMLLSRRCVDAPKFADRPRHFLLPRHFLRMDRLS